MMRSLFTGVSGLRNSQVRMDVLGNNIANVNTIGFKAGRVTFKEALAVTLRSATRPTELQGGSNAMQVGLGMAVASIDNFFAQGNLENTGQQTDLAISGDGFFVLSDGLATYYTRAGAFIFDADGRLVNPANGWVVQGRLAEADGTISSGAPIQNITLPFGQSVPAHATTFVKISGNLNASESPKGTITDSRAMFAIEQAGDDTDIEGLYAKGDTNAKITGLINGITNLVVDDGTTSKIYTYNPDDLAGSNDQFSSLDDVIQEINDDFAGSFQVAFDANGALVMTDTSGAAHTLTFTSNNALLQSAFSAANGSVDSSVGQTTTTDEFSHVATATDLLVSLRDASGNSLDLAVADTIDISGKVAETLLTSSLPVGAATTLQDLADTLRSVYGISGAPGVTIDETDGSLKILGDPGEENAITAVSIREIGNDVFIGTMTFAETQAASDVTHTATSTVYDELGEKHLLQITFFKSNTTNQWDWRVSFNGDETVISGGSGRAIFNSDGSLSTFVYDDSSTTLKFDPGNGASPVVIDLQAGANEGLNGLTQFAAASNVLIPQQDGYTKGDLSSMTIDDGGRLVGTFTNGVTQAIAQISLALFNNPSGLLRVGDNSYIPTPNAGDAVIGYAGESIDSSIIAGALEMSNVDLAQEFTNMIVAQRGFQANTRIITTSDEMLTELIAIKR
jgi:flagellar hook protein FlgE